MKTATEIGQTTEQFITRNLIARDVEVPEHFICMLGHSTFELNQKTGILTNVNSPSEKINVNDLSDYQIEQIREQLE